MHTSAADEELIARQSSLRREATTLLEELDRAAILTNVGQVALAGSYVSELMCWRELDVMVLVGVDYSPADVLQLISRLMQLPGVVGFDYRDERADRRAARSRIADQGCVVSATDLLALLWGLAGIGLLARREGAVESVVSQPVQAG